jgi:hypothetical protein
MIEILEDPLQSHSTSITNNLLKALLHGGYIRSVHVYFRSFFLGVVSKLIFSITSPRSIKRLLFTQYGLTQLLRTGMMFGLFGGLFKYFSCLGVKVFGEKWSSFVIFISAILASQSLRLERSGSKRSVYATYTLVRAVYFIGNSYWANHLHHAGPTQASHKKNSSVLSFIHPIIHRHGAPILFVISCTQIMWCWFYYPKYVEGIYYTWITRMAHMDDDLVKALRYLHHGKVKYGTRSNILEKYCIRHGLDPNVGNLLHYLPMNYVHPPDGNWTSLWIIRRYIVGLCDSVPLYAPVYFLPVILFQSKSLISQPISTFSRVVQNIMQSSSFLAFFITLTWLPILFSRRLLRKDTSFGVFLGCICCGCSIYIERKSRRKELAMFVFPRVLEIWYQYMVSNKIFRPINNGAIWIFSFACAIVAKYSMQNSVPKIEDRIKKKKSSSNGHLFSGMFQLLLH